MKQPVNFRLSSETQALLAKLALEKHLSKTRILEEAVKAYAHGAKARKPKVTKPHPMERFAGILSEEDEEAFKAGSKRHGSRPILLW